MTVNYNGRRSYALERGFWLVKVTAPPTQWAPEGYVTWYGPYAAQGPATTARNTYEGREGYVVEAFHTVTDWQPIELPRRKR